MTDSPTSTMSSQTLVENSELPLCCQFCPPLSVLMPLRTVAPEITWGDVETSRTWSVKHDDHIDKVRGRNIWSQRTTSEIQTCSGFDWYTNWVLEDEDSLTNTELRQDPAVQDCLQKLASLTRFDFPALDNIYSQLDGQRIPLFEDEDGDEYQIRLGIHSSLPLISCPSNSGDDTFRPKCPLYQLRGLISEPLSSHPRVIPKYVIRLGQLEVRTSSRYPECYEEPETITECTDYEVMIDAESDDMPVWLFVSQPQLEDRLRSFIYAKPISVPPVFRGSLLDGKSNFFDCACMLPSIRDLRTVRPRGEMLEDACKLIQETRNVRFPGVIRQTDDQLEQFIGQAAPPERIDAEKNGCLLDEETAAAASDLPTLEIDEELVFLPGV